MVRACVAVMGLVLALDEPMTRLRPEAPARKPYHQARERAEYSVQIAVTNHYPSAVVDERLPDL